MHRIGIVGASGYGGGELLRLLEGHPTVGAAVVAAHSQAGRPVADLFPNLPGDREAGFLPGSGRLDVLRLPPPDAHVRVDSGVVEGDTVTIHYDPMIAKLIVWDSDRPRALARLRDALARCAIEGPKSNIAFLERLARHPRVVEGSIDTGYLDRHLEEFVAGDDEVSTDLLLAAASARLMGQERDSRGHALASNDPGSPWATSDGWRLGHGGRRSMAFLHREQRLELHARGSNGEYRIEHDGKAHEVQGARQLADGALGLRINERGLRVSVDVDGRMWVVHDGRQRLRLQAVAMYQREHASDTAAADNVLAPMPGRVVVVKSAVGDTVVSGQELMVIEAMKMELSLKAPRDGTIARITAAEGEFVEADAVLVALEVA